MNRLSTARRAQIVSSLVEGNGVRATARLTGSDKETVMWLHSDLGTMCEIFQRGVLRDLRCTRIECDEIWSFVGCKAKNVPDKRRGEYGGGEVYTEVPLDPDANV